MAQRVVLFPLPDSSGGKTVWHCSCHYGFKYPLHTVRKMRDSLLRLDAQDDTDDYFGTMTTMEWTTAFAWPFGGFVVSYLAFSALMRIVPRRNYMFLIRIFAMAAVATYYWFRLPMLFGYAELPNNSTLIDLTGVLPVWFPEASQVATTVFFAWFMLLRKSKRSWTVRPAYSEAAAASMGANL